MKTYTTIKNAIITSAFASLLLVGFALSASAQNVDQQYRQWQRAQAEAAQRQQDYLRTRNMRDYREWQQAQLKAQREYSDYQRASTYGNNNNGRWNDRNDSWANGNNRNNGRFRVYTNGSYYETDSRGAELLKQAVRNGYTQGYRQGQTDRNYRRGFDYNGNSSYRSGTYGYQSYVGRDQYQYYFQQGFQRGYEDGYNSTNRYGYRSGNSFNILGNILNTIINFTNDR